MAFLRFTRDKRGYEYFYLVEPTNRRGKATTRVLYWFRTPPNIKVGREPFDESVRRMLETQNPGVVFDWRKILDTPIPSADAERWRERRRLERAEKAARRSGPEDEPLEPADDEEKEPTPDEPPVASGATLEPEHGATEEPVATAPLQANADAARRKRRRRRRRTGAPGAPPSNAPPPTEGA